ncbi:hypothetical protein, conserved [Leishmania lindenbergi]|uniref:Uncharacterized protein n=1 Tax=Leishmania lindenbergi TaxID=651832 RepID=A0AAW3AQ81_9TRYP
MHRRATAHGFQQALIPFSVAHSSPPAAHCSSACESGAVGDEAFHAEPLYLSLQQGERVRVLQRECHHGTGPHGASSHMLVSAAGGAALSQPQWCIAEREDGAIGLVPGSLLQRVPGALFFARHGVAAVTAHRGGSPDPPSLKPSTATRRGHHRTVEASGRAPSRGFEVVRTTQTPSASSGSPGNDVSEKDDKVGYENTDVVDALQLQRRRQSSLQGRLNAACATPLTAMLTHKEPQTTTSTTSLPTAARGTETASDSDCSEEDEQLHLMKEEARVRAELRWLMDVVLPRLQAACTKAQARLEKLRQDERCANVVASTSSFSSSVDPPNPLAALDREHEGVAGLLERVEALQVELAREASAGAVSEPQRSQSLSGNVLTVSSPRCESGDSSAPAVFRSLDFDAAPPRPLKALHRCRDDVTANAPKAPDSHIVEKLRLLVIEEMETVGSYRSQKLALQQRLSRLAELMQEVASEEASLKESETALHRLLEEGTSEFAVDFAWPRTLQGLTDEEEVVLSSSVHILDKYTRKLQLIADDGQCSTSTNLMSSSVDVSPLANAPIASLDTATCAATPDRQTHSNSRAAMSEGSSTVTTPTPSRVDHLRQVMERGGRELAQLQTKLKAAQRFCDTYGPIAQEIDEQLRRGERILAEKKKYLAALQAAESGEALRNVC